MSKQGDFDAFLRATKAQRGPSADDATRVAGKATSQIDWNRALPSAMNSALDAELANAATPASATGKASASSRGWKVALGAASAVIIGVAAYTVGTTSSERSAPAPSVVTTPTPNPVTETKPSEPSEPTAPPVPVLADPSLLPTAAQASARVPSPASAPTSSGSLDAELAMLAETSAALRRHDPSKALSLVVEHGRRFPNGVLGPEFTAQRILALSALGRKSEACSEATKFIAANESSPLLPQVRAACEGTKP